MSLQIAKKKRKVKMTKSFKQRFGSFILKNTPLSKEVISMLRFEFKAFKIRLSKKINPFFVQKIKTAIQGENLSVNIGAGPTGKKDWVNIDMDNHKNISFVYDCRRNLPFRNSTVARIRCEHVLEHLDLNKEVYLFLKECLRSLQKNGVLRIIVPDIEIFINAYYKKDVNEWGKLGWNINKLPDGMKTPAYILNHVFRQDGEHKFGYDFETLELILKEIGFSKVIKQSFQKSIDNQLIDDHPEHQTYSIYVDAVK